MLRAVLLALALALLVAAPADAYRLGGKKWPVRTITYHASAPQYADAITAAVAAWNASGVRVRFKAVSRRSKARVKIVYGRVRSGPSGDAHLGYYRKSRVRLNRFDPAGKDPGWLANQMQIVVAHELGHVLGLRHVTKPCSVMNYGRTEDCPKPPAPWQLRCRLLEPDDVRGAIKRYGGRAKGYAGRVLRLRAAAGAARGAHRGLRRGTRSIALSWTNAGEPVRVRGAVGGEQGRVRRRPDGAGAVTQPGPGTGVIPPPALRPGTTASRCGARTGSTASRAPRWRGSRYLRVREIRHRDDARLTDCQ